ELPQRAFRERVLAQNERIDFQRVRLDVLELVAQPGPPIFGGRDLIGTGIPANHQNRIALLDVVRSTRIAREEPRTPGNDEQIVAKQQALTVDFDAAQEQVRDHHAADQSDDDRGSGPETRRRSRNLLRAMPHEKHTQRVAEREDQQSRDAPEEENHPGIGRLRSGKRSCEIEIRQVRDRAHLYYTNQEIEAATRCRRGASRTHGFQFHRGLQTESISSLAMKTANGCALDKAGDCRVLRGCLSSTQRDVPQNLLCDLSGVCGDPGVYNKPSRAWPSKRSAVANRAHPMTNSESERQRRQSPHTWQ